MERNYDALLDEIAELRKALSSTRDILERYKSDNESLQVMQENLKLHHERSKKECQESQIKCAEALKSLKETQNYYELYVQKLKASLEQGKRDFEEMQTKMIPPIDSEWLRVKLVNEIEGPMKIQVEAKEDEIARLQGTIYDLTRKLDLSQLQLNGLKTDAEREVRDMKERYANETGHLFAQIKILNEKLEDPADKETIRVVKREREELKLKNEKAFEEIEDLRKKLENVKFEKNELKGKYLKDLEDERNRARIFSIDRDKLEITNKDLADQVHRYKLTLESKSQEISNLKRDLESTSNSLETSEIQLKQLREEINILQNRIHEKEFASENKLKEFTKNEREKYSKDKEEREKMIKTIDSLERKLKESTSQSQSADRENKYELDRKKQEVSNLKEDLKLLETKNLSLSKEVEIYKQNLSAKAEEIERYQNEMKNLTGRYNEVLKSNEGYIGKIQQIETKYEKFTALGRENSDYKNLEEKLKHSEGNVQFFKSKAREYKEKVKVANEKIQELGVKLAKSEIERQKLIGNPATGKIRP
jgi:chromosome segregation ATPase